jgi:hypothetical protein
MRGPFSGPMKSRGWVIRSKDLLRNWGWLRVRAVGFAALVGEPALRVRDRASPRGFIAKS